jgi:hypothetical protein
MNLVGLKFCLKKNHPRVTLGKQLGNSNRVRLSLSHKFHDAGREYDSAGFFMI